MIPKCPACGTNKGAVTVSGYYRCGKCGGLYDDSPHEGGTHSTFNPGARLEREERQKQRRKERRR